MTTGSKYLKEARRLVVRAKSQQASRHKVFDFTEAIVMARYAGRQDPSNTRLRSAAGKIEHDAREAICALALEG